jgi:amidohydrolase
MNDTLALAERYQAEMVGWRRHLHQYPEVGLDTPLTSAYIATQLQDLGLEVCRGCGGHGVVGLLRGDAPGKAFAIRADIDALPVAEATGLPFASRHPGRMHACGHDGHAAIALGAARILSQLAPTLAGPVKFIFQPGEEGPGGAAPMIGDGVLEAPPVGAIIGLHLGVIWDLPSGAVGVRPGATMASMDRFDIEVVGRGGHGAMPERTVDTLCAAAALVMQLQTIVSRRISPLEPAVVTVGSLAAGSAFNVIAERAHLSGTTRALSPTVRAALPGLIAAVAEGVATGTGAEVRVDYQWGYPVLENDAAFTAFFRELATGLLGRGRVFDLPAPTMGGEDMAFYLQQVPGTFFALGSGTPERGTVHPHHSPKFDFDEEVMWVGAALLAESARRWLAECR